MSDRETMFWFGKYGPKGDQPGKDLSEVPAGYLNWMVENFDAKPLPKDTKGMTQEEVNAMEQRMVNFLEAAADELKLRDET